MPGDQQQSFMGAPDDSPRVPAEDIMEVLRGAAPTLPRLPDVDWKPNLRGRELSVAAPREFMVMQHGRGEVHLLTSSGAQIHDGDSLPLDLTVQKRVAQYWMTEVAPGIFMDVVTLPDKELVLYQATPELNRVSGFLVAANLRPHLEALHVFGAVMGLEEQPIGVHWRVLRDVCFVLGRDFALSRDGEHFFTWPRGTYYQDAFASSLVGMHNLVVHFL